MASTATPFQFLSAERLRGLAAYFAAEPAVVSVTIEHDGVATTVTRRDLRLIHALAASRFGDVDGCPFCEVVG